MAKRRRRRGLSLTGTIVAFILIIIAALFQDEINLDLTDGADRIDETQFGDLQTISLDQGFGATRDFWQVYFTAPGVNSNDDNACNGGVDEAVVNAIDTVQSTLDIAAFEWDNPCLTDAVVRAANRGVTVRMVVDDVHTVSEHEDAVLFGDPSPFGDIVDAGIPYRDDSRSGLMHNKFMILDGSTVITGSMNFTLNGAYRNNNNLVILRSRRAAEIFQAEFNEMFERGEFGSSRSTVDGGAFNQDGVPVRISFSPEDQPVSVMEQEIRNAQQSIRFMVFSFTRDDLGMALLDRAQAGVDVAGIFETTGSRTQFSELPRLLCAGVPVFQDGNPGIFHHKVFVIDATTVITGSFNISEAATTSNDENVVIIRDPDVAALYLAEYERARREATVPPADQIVCP
jgi:phosphatidylserine/phosphatidylglycerophosphate/cardiolipin synthase-like enzyme